MNMVHAIKFRHLTTFLEVARQKSVGKAADSLAVTQPAVTRTIRELEEAIGAPVFEKEGRGIKLTHFGEIFLRHAGESVASVKRGMDAITLVQKNQGPPLRIGALPTASATFMPEAVSQFMKLETGSPVTVVTGENRWLVEALRVGDLDLAVGRMASPEQMQGLVFEPLYTEEVVFAVRAGHPVLADRVFSFDQLDAYLLLMPTWRSVIRPLVDRMLLTHGISALPKAIETVSDSFGRALVARHDAIWIISKGVVAAELKSGTFVRLDVDMAETQGAVGITTRLGTDMTTSLQLFLQVIRSSIGDMSPT